MLLRLALLLGSFSCASFAAPAPGVEEAAAPFELVSPISLSDPDGQELVLEGLAVRAEVEGPLALTELDLRFRNPQGRRIEGRFSLTLPEGAAVSRFAKTVNGQLVEGEVVERQRAHRIYDTILQEMRDPGLLEQDQGNRFTAKIFPIEANAEVRVVLSYSQLLRREAGTRTWSVPLRGLPEIGDFQVHARFTPLPGETSADVPGAERSRGGVVYLDRSEQGWRPAEDLAVAWRSTGSATQALAAGDYHLVSLTPSVAAPAPARGPWRFYVDTSASAADGLEHRLAALQAMLRALPPGDDVDVRAFDQAVVPVVTGDARAVAASLPDLLRRRGYAGGTDMERVLADAGTARAGTRVVLVTDGIATFGELNPTRWSVPAHVALHAVVLGPEQDGVALRQLTQGRGRVVEVPFSTALAARAAEATAELQRALGTTVPVEVPGAAWSAVVGAEDVLPGDEILVLWKAPRGVAVTPRVRGATVAASPAGSVAEPLLERELVRLRLAELALAEQQASTPEEANAASREQIALSVAHRVLSPKTTLLVLESEADYARFGLERRALAAILAPGPEGLVQVDRGALVSAPEAKPVKEAARRQDDGRADGQVDALDRDDEEAPARKAKAEEAEIVQDADLAGTDPADTDGASAERREQAPGEAPLPVEEGRAMAPPPASGPVADARALASASRRSRSEPSGEPALAARPEVDRRTTAQPAGPPAWAQPVEVPTATLRELEARLAANPRDRAAYNQLSDALLATRGWDRLATLAVAWQPLDPDNPHVYEVMGEAALGRGDLALARRAFASLAEVAAGKPELLQRAGVLLARAGDTDAALVPLRRAVELRPDRANAWRHLALVLRLGGRPGEAAQVLQDALQVQFPDVYGDVHRVLREELAACWREQIAADPRARASVEALASAAGLDLARVDALRVTLVWETDGNDVDLHVVDPSGEECFYSHTRSRSGLELYQDITRGFGPEVVRTSERQQGAYVVGVKYFSAGPMGVSRGLLLIEEPGKAPRIEPFRLVEGGGAVRRVGVVQG